MSAQIIATNKVVSLAYTLMLNSGELADEATTDEPLVFIHGIGQTLAALATVNLALTTSLKSRKTSS